LVTVTLSVVEEVLLLPLTSAMIIMRKIAPPTIHAQGWVYQVSVVVVEVEVLVLLEATELSCANAIKDNKILLNSNENFCMLNFMIIYLRLRKNIMELIQQMRQLLCALQIR
jgi:hypothetical protein